MRIVNPSYTILNEIDGIKILKKIEGAGRTCYKSEDKITGDSAIDFVKMISGKGHNSVIEHESLSIRFVFDRGVSHEIVRHRLASFSQESTRYCNYSKSKYDNQITVIKPVWCTNLKECEILDRSQAESMEGINEDERQWICAMLYAEHSYNLLTKNGWSAQQARSVLPNSLKTEIVVTANLREWNTIFQQRASKMAHPQMREIMKPLLDDLKLKIPAIFDNTCEKLAKEDLTGIKHNRTKIHFIHSPNCQWDMDKHQVADKDTKNPVYMSTQEWKIDENLTLQDLMDKYKNSHIVFYLKGHSIYSGEYGIRMFSYPRED